MPLLWAKIWAKLYAPSRPPVFLPKSMAEKPRSVLITRAAAAQDDTAAQLSARGYMAIPAPCLKICATPLKLPRNPVQAVVIGSANALPSLPASLRGIKLLAVGDATADAAQKAGFKIVYSAAGDGAALADLAAASLNPASGPLLLPCAAGEGKNLASLLRARGFTVYRRTAYRVTIPKTLPPAALAALREAQVYAAIFLSARTAENFIRLLPAADRHYVENLMAVAIGKLTADRLKRLPWGAIRVASRPALNEVLDLL
jgi:uroporphyrinogen-III synthase